MLAFVIGLRSLTTFGFTASPDSSACYGITLRYACWRSNQQPAARRPSGLS